MAGRAHALDVSACYFPSFYCLPCNVSINFKISTKCGRSSFLNPKHLAVYRPAQDTNDTMDYLLLFMT